MSMKFCNFCQLIRTSKFDQMLETICYNHGRPKTYTTTCSELGDLNRSKWKKFLNGL